VRHLVLEQGDQNRLASRMRLSKKSSVSTCRCFNATNNMAVLLVVAVSCGADTTLLGERQGVLHALDDLNDARNFKVRGLTLESDGTQSCDALCAKGSGSAILPGSPCISATKGSPVQTGNGDCAKKGAKGFCFCQVSQDETTALAETETWMRNNMHTQIETLHDFAERVEWNKLLLARSLRQSGAIAPRKYPVVVMAQFFNESHIIREWVDHYLWQGVDHFILIDNCDVCPADESNEILGSYIKNGQVTLIRDLGKHQQLDHYTKYSKPFLALAEWIMVVDMDEFVYARRGWPTIGDYLNSLSPAVVQLCVPWKVYGSSGQIEIPSSAVDAFTKRHPKAVHCKGIMRADATKGFEIHVHYLTDINAKYGHCINTANIKRECRQPLEGNETRNYNAYDLHLNHYAIQSLNWFKAVKMTRGSANTAVFDHIRNLDYFKKFDKPATMVDTELKDMRASAAAAATAAAVAVAEAPVEQPVTGRAMARWAVRWGMKRIGIE
jgi:hypothetical protein